MRANMATGCVVRGFPEIPLLIDAPIQVFSCRKLQNQEHSACWITKNGLVSIKNTVSCAKLGRCFVA